MNVIVDAYVIKSTNNVMMLTSNGKTYEILFIDSVGSVRLSKTFDYSHQAVSFFETVKAGEETSLPPGPWRDISTIPTDGRKVKVIDKSGRVSELYANPEGRHHFQENYTLWSDN